MSAAKLTAQQVGVILAEVKDAYNEAADFSQKLGMNGEKPITVEGVDAGRLITKFSRALSFIPAMIGITEECLTFITELEKLSEKHASAKAAGGEIVH